jgi:hypothetical protein
MLLGPATKTAKALRNSRFIYIDEFTAKIQDGKSKIIAQARKSLST